MNLGSSGDGDEDDASAMGLISSSQCWTPEAWHTSPDGLTARAKSMNEAAFASAAACAGKHSNPPNGGTDRPY